MGATATVVLAAGAGTRFDGSTHKLASALADGTSLARRAVEVALAAAVGPVGVVVGAVDAARLDLPAGATVIANPVWADGQATSLQAAVRWAGGAGHDAVVVALADQPGLTTSAWRAVAAATATPVAVATYDGRRGHPVRLGEAAWPLLPTTGEEGARSVLRARPELVTEVPCAGDPADIDTAADLARWHAAHPTDGPGHAR
ncbi:MAG TPA: NTP transferase domain-containing protein [Aquihabitans sp.]|nr:NTP transferase domain-containing protein [Aquihabitans sp.]